MFAGLRYGAAAAALVVFAGAVQAADPMVVIPPAAPPAPEAAAENDVAFRIDVGLWNDWDFDPFDARDFELFGQFVVDFQRPAGWGFQLLGGVDVDVPPPLDPVFYLTGRAYRSSGNLTVGVYGFLEAYLSNFDDLGLGWDLAYRTGRITIYNDNWAQFVGGFTFNNQTTIDFEINEKVTLSGGVFLDFFPGPIFVGLDARAELDLGSFKPYVYAYWTPTGGFGGAGVGAEVEHPIGTGPLSLIATANLNVEFGGPVDVDLSIGVRYSRGAVNTPWWWDR